VALVPKPVTVTGYVPAGVVGVVAIMRVDQPPEAIDDGLNVAVAPVGRPDAFRFTVCAEPSVTAVGTVEVTELPGFTAADDGVSVIEKSLAEVGAVEVGALEVGAVVVVLIVAAGGIACVERRSPGLCGVSPPSLLVLLRGWNRRLAARTWPPTKEGPQRRRARARRCHRGLRHLPR